MKTTYPFTPIRAMFHLMNLNQGLYQAATWRRNDVVLTSMRRDEVASTSVQRYYDVMCLMSSFFYHKKDKQTI